MCSYTNEEYSITHVQQAGGACNIHWYASALLALILRRHLGYRVEFRMHITASAKNKEHQRKQEKQYKPCSHPGSLSAPKALQDVMWILKRSVYQSAGSAGDSQSPREVKEKQGRPEKRWKPPSRNNPSTPGKTPVYH